MLPEASGFVFFPFGENIRTLDIGKTYVYIVAIDVSDRSQSTVSLHPNGCYSGNDVEINWHNDNLQLEDKVKELQTDDRSIEKYFVSSVLVGWSDMTFYNSSEPWVCQFNDLTEYGKRLYFDLKKLHYDKDIKILTFNHIKHK